MPPFYSVQEIYEQTDHKQVLQEVRVFVGAVGILVQGVESIAWRFEIGSVPTASIGVKKPFNDTFFGMLTGPWGSAFRTRIEIWIGFKAGLSFFKKQVFQGRISSISSDGAARTIECVGESDALDAPYENAIITLAGQDQNTALVAMAATAGVPNFVSNLPTRTLGNVAPINLGFSSFGEGINKITALDGSPWYEMPTGQVRADVRDPIPAIHAARTYFSMRLIGPVEVYPDEITDHTLRPRLRNASLNLSPRDVANRIIISGAQIESEGPNGATNTNQVETTCDGPSDYVPTPPQFQVFQLSNELIDLDGMAADVCTRYFQLKNILPVNVSAEIDGDPCLFLGMIVGIVDPDYSQINANFFLQGYSCQLDKDDFVSSLTLVGNPDLIYPEIDPFAEFTWKLQNLTSGDTPGSNQHLPNLKNQKPDGEELLNCSMGGDKLTTFVPDGAGDPDSGEGENKTMVRVSFDGSSSADFDGVIVGYAWSDDQGHSGTGVRWSVLYDPDDGTSIAVTLTVTDNDGRTDDITKTVRIDVENNPGGDPADPPDDDTDEGGGPGSGAATCGGGILVAASKFAMIGSAEGTWTDYDMNGGVNWFSGQSVGGHFISAFSGGSGPLFGTDGGEIVQVVDNKARVVLRSGPGPVYSFAAGNSQIFAAVGDRIYFSDDGGETWAPAFTSVSGSIHTGGNPSFNFEQIGLGEVTRLAIADSQLVAFSNIGIYAADLNGPSLDFKLMAAWLTPGGYDFLGKVIEVSTSQNAMMVIRGDYLDKQGKAYLTEADAYSGFEAVTGEAPFFSASAPGDNAGEMYVASGDTVYGTSDNHTFTVIGTVPDDIRHMANLGGGVILAGGSGGIYMLIDTLTSGLTFGNMRPNVSIPTTWPAGAQVEQIATSINAMVPDSGFGDCGFVALGYSPTGAPISVPALSPGQGGYVLYAENLLGTGALTPSGGGTTWVQIGNTVIDGTRRTAWQNNTSGLPSGGSISVGGGTVRFWVVRAALGSTTSVQFFEEDSSGAHAPESDLGSTQWAFGIIPELKVNKKATPPVGLNLFPNDGGSLACAGGLSGTNEGWTWDDAAVKPYTVFIASNNIE